MIATFAFRMKKLTLFCICCLIIAILIFIYGCKAVCPCRVINVDHVRYVPGMSADDKRDYYELTVIDSNKRERHIKSYSYHRKGEIIK